MLLFYCRSGVVTYFVYRNSKSKSFNTLLAETVNSRTSDNTILAETVNLRTSFNIALVETVKLRTSDNTLLAETVKLRTSDNTLLAETVKLRTSGVLGFMVCAHVVVFYKNIFSNTADKEMPTE